MGERKFVADEGGIMLIQGCECTEVQQKTDCSGDGALSPATSGD